MSSLTTCSGQGVVIQEKGNEKECVVKDMENKSSQEVDRMEDHPVVKMEGDMEVVDAEFECRD